MTDEYLLRAIVHIASNESGDWVLVVLPVFRHVTVRDWTQRSRANEHIAVKYDGSYGNQSYHGVEVEHILEFVPLPPEKCKHQC